MAETTPPKIQNGYYQITDKDTGIYLRVFPPVNGGAPVEETMIIEHLRNEKITKFEQSLLSTTILEASGESIRIAEAPPPLLPDVRVMVRRDRLEAMVNVTTPPGAIPVTMPQLLDKLKASGVVYGIDKPVLEWLVKARSSLNTICAEGVSPRNGDNAYLKYHVDVESQGRPVELEDGSVDFKNINNFLCVTEGQLLLEKIPPTLGTPGVDVIGLPIAAKPGKDISLPFGKNVTIVDNCRLVAAIEGQLHIVRQRLNVIPTIEVVEDVDYSTGNIDFVGNVIVHGSVQPGFSIKAGGNVEIWGSVNGGMVEGNSIIIRTGVKGMNRSVIKSRDRVVAKFIENATVYADQEVIISDVVLNSSIFAGIRVIVEGRRGIVIGGRVSAGEKIRIRTCGNQSHVTTDLEVSANPFLKDELTNLRNENKKNQVLIKELQRSLEYLRNQGLSPLNAEKQDHYKQMGNEYNALQERTEEIRQRLTDVENLLYCLKPGKISVSDVLYPGVRVCIGPLTKVISESLKYLALYAHEGEIKFSSFRS